jgi:hypothetical protein
MAAYFTEIFSNSAVQAAIAAFFAGKAIKEGLEAWGLMYNQLSKFFHHSGVAVFGRSPTFDREAAAILVYKAAVDTLGGVPKTFQLKGFAIQYRNRFVDRWDAPKPEIPIIIAPQPERVEQQMIYVFYVEADGRDLLATVDGPNVKFIELA